MIKRHASIAGVALIDMQLLSLEILLVSFIARSAAVTILNFR